jgi:hypothetical protein
MALNFPSSPTNGQVYDNWIYSSAKGAWEAKPLDSAKTITADVAPANPDDGDQWFNTIDGTLYIYVVDLDGGQWVESQAPITANGYYSPNYLINGAFEINQRNFTSTTTPGYHFDRWQGNHFNTGTATFSSQAFTPGTAPQADFEGSNFYRIVTSGVSGTNSLTFTTQKIENVRSLAGKTVTVSFWAKAASGTPNVGISFEQRFGNAGSAMVPTTAGVVVLSTGWARYSVTVSLPSVLGKTIGPNSHLQFNLSVSSGSDFPSVGIIGLQNNTFDFWGVQVESGTVATTFRRNANSIQGELAACQRYYQRYTAESINTGFSIGMMYSAPLFISRFSLITKMRIAPSSLEWTGNSSDYQLLGNASGFTISQVFIESASCSTDAIELRAIPSTSLTVGQAMLLRALNSSTYIGFSAEL